MPEDQPGTGPGTGPVAVPDLVPAPVSARFGGDRCALTDPLLLAGPGTGDTARWLRRELGAATGWELPAPAGAERSAEDRQVIRLALRPDLAERHGPEWHEVHVGDRGVLLEGADPAGVFRAAQTLRQLLGPDAFRRAPLRPGGRAWTLPVGDVLDGPRFAWRGLMLDVARHFLPKDGVLRYLDLLAAHKLNVLHLHLTDDQGWRIHIARHPRLTEVGAWRPRSRWGHRASPLWNDTPHGGFYTHDDIREIVAYAAERHVRVVPEIDIPGHSQAAVAAYPELGNTDAVDTSSLTVWEDWGISENVLAPTEAVLRFYEGVFEEVLELFPPEVSPFVHIGGDECPKHQWRRSPTAQDRIRELGVGDEDGLQSWFVRHFDRWLAARGRRLIGWDEILEGGLADGAAVSSWRGYAGGVAAAEAGHDVVMCPEQQVYLDHRQDGGPDEPVPIGYVRTLEDVYRFEPVPPELSPEAARHVLGAQANVWTEVMENQDRVDYQVFPRLAAFAEVVWSPLPEPAARDFASFEARMATHYARLDALGVAYRPPAGPRPWQRRPGVLGRPIEGAPPGV
ncbi:beta-N-acetylhexosaminidase [Streptomyces antimicrobicus]|uniref:beta-N-acetylhexosaminidase n=1 Tax=Streptomyces antimicrobicus TaxID=2883108 RepID=A0ABS8BCI8_9ACTN|nr:beta-N-acetylhexosaminidase [Streptomyces antimicrobicus]MCB5182352.1 beta-N-acetylhexosaminidase [Streptomyces antimicrobicus]